MLKKFTAEGRFECGLDKIIAGKVWAFTVHLVPRSSFLGLGVAAANEPGYWPIPLTWCHGDHYGQMSDHVDELNRALGWSDEQSAKIICSSMASRPILSVPDKMPDGDRFKVGDFEIQPSPNLDPMLFGLTLKECQDAGIKIEDGVIVAGHEKAVALRKAKECRDG